MNENPNIILLTSDQQKASATNIYGNAHVPAPFTKHLAETGIVFEHAFTCAPICTPSRASIHTGVHPLVHQSTCHQNRVPYNLPQLAELLAGGGYYTTVIGHYEKTRNLGRGWHEQIDLHDDCLGPAYALKNSVGRRDVGWSSGGLPCTPKEGLSHLMADRTLIMIDEAIATGAPFFMHVSFIDPHAPYFAPPPYDTAVDPGGLPLPNLGNDLGRPAWQKVPQKEYGTEAATEDDLRRVLAVYYGMIAGVDAAMQRIYDALAARGLLDNTWIIFTSDHGDFTGEKGLFTKTESLYECLLHVPLVIAPPTGREAPRNRRVSGLVENLDLFASILGIAGVEVPEYAQSNDLVAWVEEGAERALRDCAFAQVGDYGGMLGQTLPGGIVPSGRHRSLLQGARSPDFSYTRDPDYGDEAYDLNRDPLELDNLLNPGRQTPPPAVDHLRRRVGEWETECIELRERLGIIPGARGFDEGWE